MTGVPLRLPDGADRPWPDIAADLDQAGWEVTLSGPEPSESVHLLRAIAHVAGRRVVLVTNGRVFSQKKRVAAVVQAGVTGLDLCLWGGPTNHDAHDGQGAFARVLRTFGALRDLRLVPVRIRWNLTDASINDLATIETIFRQVRNLELVVELWDNLEDDEAALRAMEQILDFAAAYGGRATAVGFSRCWVPTVAPPERLHPAHIEMLLQGAPTRRRVRGCFGIGPAGEDHLGPVVPRLLRQAGRPIGELLLAMAAYGYPVREAPRCLGGQSEGNHHRERVPACAGCPVASECGGVPRVWKGLLADQARPHPAWAGFAAGQALVVVVHEGGDPILRDATLPALVEAVVAMGYPATLVRLPEGAALPADVVSCDDASSTTLLLASLALLCDAVAAGLHLRLSAVLCVDFHMLSGIDKLRQLCGGDHGRDWWPSDNVLLYSCFPGYVHLYLAARVPLRQVVWRPYSVPIDWVKSHKDTDNEPYIHVGGNHLRDWTTLSECDGFLSGGGSPLRVFFPRGVAIPAGRRLRPLGFQVLSSFVGAIAGSAMVVVPLHPDPIRSAGITVFALALAAGKPVVATATPATADHLRDGGNALFVRPNDPRALARAIDRLDADPGLRARLARSATAAGHEASPGRWAEILTQGICLSDFQERDLDGIFSVSAW